MKAKERAARRTAFLRSFFSGPFRPALRPFRENRRGSFPAVGTVSTTSSELGTNAEVPTPVFFHFRTRRSFKIDVDVRGVGQAEIASEPGLYPTAAEVFGEFLAGRSVDGADVGFVFTPEVVRSRNPQIEVAPILRELHADANADANRSRPARRAQHSSS